MKRIRIILILITSSFTVGFSQVSFNKEIEFYNFLHQKGLQKEALFHLQQIESFFSDSTQTDSINYYKAQMLFRLKLLDSAAIFYGKVSSKSAFFNAAVFNQTYCYTYSKKYQQAIKTLAKEKFNDSLLNELKEFQLAGISLLNKNLAKYDSAKSNFSYSFYPLQKEEEELNKIYSYKKYYKKKSPIIAGVLSAIVPGLGKFYAGKKKEAIGGFFPIIATALLTLEAYNNRGIKDVRFWIFGSSFLTFYIGNIWGSTFAVKIRQSEINTINENKILFNLQIPIRNIFSN
jgi:hypothetical protein